jgi:hypothetical protein
LGEQLQVSGTPTSGKFGTFGTRIGEGLVEEFFEVVQTFGGITRRRIGWGYIH